MIKKSGKVAPETSGTQQKRFKLSSFTKSIGAEFSTHANRLYHRVGRVILDLTGTGKANTAAQKMASNMKDVNLIPGPENCACDMCSKYAKSPESVYELLSYKPNTGWVDFPKIEYRRKEGDPEISYGALAECLGLESSDEEGHTDGAQIPRQINHKNLVKILTYLELKTGDLGKQSIHDLVASFYYLYDADLNELLADDELAVDFLRKTCQLYILPWKAYFNGNSCADWCAWHMRRFLAHVLTIPNVANKVLAVFNSTTYWLEVGPLSMVQTVSNCYLFCNDTIAVLCNLTRIKDVAELLDSESKILDIIRHRFYPLCQQISRGDKLADLLVHLLVNLMVLPEFPKFLVEANSGYFVNEVLINIISNTRISRGTQLAVWPLLKNLALTDIGRAFIMENVDLYLGPILYPIAGPEEIPEEEMSNLPPEVQYLPASKVRTDETVVRDCVLAIIYSLCRYRNDRETLRKAEVYQILKHYHLVEENDEFLERIEQMVNILIRKELEEIEVDDLLDGLSLYPEPEPVPEPAEPEP